MTTPILPEGFRDRLPPQASAAARLARAVLDVLESHGYDRVMPPLVEFEAGMAGAGTDRMRVTDPVSQRTLALRSDMTRQVGRIAAGRLAHAARPLRLSYHGPVLKLRAGQLNPERELTQIGAELIGNDAVAAAAEVVAVAVEALHAAGVTGVTVDLTLPDLVETLAAGPFPLTPERVDAVRAALDMKDAGGLVDAGGAAYLPLIGVTGPFDTAIERLRAIDAGGALRTRIEGLRAIVARLPADIAITLDPTERHGFEYQTWFGFTLFATGYVGTLGRGGTYVVAENGEVATGFSLYPDPLVDALAAADVPARRCFVPPDHDGAAAARLREAGWITIAALTAADDARALGCSHRLDGAAPVPVDGADDAAYGPGHG